MEQKDKLPMYYGQIYSLMKSMAKHYIDGQAFVYRRIFKQFYSRVRPELSEEKRIYFDDKVKALNKYLPLRNEAPFEEDYRRKAGLMIGGLYEIEKELFQELSDNTSIFKVLKTHTEMELI